MTIARIKLIKEDSWWLIDPNNDPEWEKMGPYETKTEATEAKKRLTIFWRHYYDKSIDDILDYEDMDGS